MSAEPTAVPAFRSRPVDACPTALTLHPAADGGLARVRLPGGRLDSGQLTALISAAKDLGDGSLYLTSRANVQIRAVTPGAEAELADRLAAAGLLPSISHERCRNIVASPLSGLDGVGSHDVSSLSPTLDEALCATAELAGLSGRFLFGFDDGRGDIAELNPDVCLRAVATDRFRLVVAGTDAGIEVELADVVALALAAAGAFVAERSAQHSNAWRIAELAGGAGTVIDRLTAAESSWASSGTAVAAQPLDLTAATSDHTGPTVGGFTATDGGSYLVIGVPLGQLDPEQLSAIANIATITAQGAGIIVTPWRSIVIHGLAATTNGTTRADLQLLARVGLVVDPTSSWLGVSACTGRPGCASALADVRSDARQTQPLLSPSRSVPLHWIGCERACGTPAGTVMQIQATGTGYRLSLATGHHSTSDQPVDVAAAIEELLRTLRTP